MRVWDRFLTDQDKAHLAARTGRPRSGFGTKAAVLSIDNYRGAVGDARQPLLESIGLWPSSTGLAGWTALGYVEELFAAARAAGVPIVHATGLAPESSGITRWAQGSDAIDPADTTAADRHARRFDIVDQAAPLPGEAVLRKTEPSAFFGTPLMAHLNTLDVDTLIVCGESTSGCVRATVVDGRSYRFKVVVVEECVYDRHESAHAINLFDMDQKYADVLSLDEVMRWIKEQSTAGR